MIPPGPSLSRVLLVAALPLAPVPPAAAHPHVFVDGGVDFVFGEGTRLEALRVTWLFDPFETLYTLAAVGVIPDEAGRLAPKDRQRLIEDLGDWPDDFDGSVHLSSGAAEIGLGWPRDLDVRLVEGRLEMTFSRRLASPLDLRGGSAEVAFYEATYFYAFSITKRPVLDGADDRCAARTIPFDPDPTLAALQTTLSALGREEAPEIEDVGALFADRIVVTCA